MSARRSAIVAAAWLSAAASAAAGELAVTDAWSRTTPPGLKVGVAYLTIHNDTKKSDRLLRLRTPVAARAEVHRTEVLDGISRMREVAVLHLAPGETVRLEPGGLHVMLMGLAKPLAEGGTFELELDFEVAGPRTVRVSVRRP